MAIQIRRPLLGILLVSLLSAAGYAQPTLADPQTANSQSPALELNLEQLDQETEKLGIQIAQKLTAMGSGIRLWIGNFSFEGEETILGTYLVNQLSGILANRENSGYTIMAEPVFDETGGQGAENEYYLGGEILQLGNVLRVYTKLIRPLDFSLHTAWNTDFQISPFIEELITAPSGSSSSRTRRDRHEPDSMESPLDVEIGAWVSRTLHEGDEDWFRIRVGGKGVLVLETSDATFDPVMELYNGSNLSRIDRNDDGGQGLNSRIEVIAETGQVFIAKVQGCDRGEIGEYRFRTTLEALEDNTEPNDSFENATALEPNPGPIYASFRTRSDLDYYRLEIPAPGNGRLTVYTESDLDTVLTLYDSNEEIIDQDDDSGSGTNARISTPVPAGTVYIEVRELENDRGRYTLHLTYEQ
jgi:hypothetical protein